ncbi:hypothetical protein SLEP1_g54821 [Rubroshorea leprosula]|uniref:Uncharacterized protein n=1 Tax=Rubroshorea leprosula TaxID=152421 RepID=A0AAV5ME99_9ROSI|nr:hypothetical protein SLEP1_g54821 [Rubroshorea leprosula]
MQILLTDIPKELFVTSDENLEIKTIQAGGLEAVTAMNSSSSGEMGILQLSLQQLEPWHGSRTLVHFASPPGAASALCCLNF